MENDNLKDANLNRLAAVTNVAQFVSFSPNLSIRFNRIQGFGENVKFETVEGALTAILERAPEGCVNVRSFEPDNPKSRAFIYGLTSVGDVLSEVTRLADEGLFTVVNETIDVNDGGVSGVAFGGVVEFAPGDTPRCVEKPGTAAMRRDLALDLFRTVFSIVPTFPGGAKTRVEFSLHPLRRGVMGDHFIIWETEEVDHAPTDVNTVWPNRFSRAVGDKTFGLLIADLIGLNVPSTIVIPRTFAPFAFGKPTGIAEPWLRTAPIDQQPGYFTTSRGWQDPFRLVAKEDVDGDQLASVLCQKGVPAQYSGALLAGGDGELVIEGVAGSGERFMLGESPPETLPPSVTHDLRACYEAAFAVLGPVRFEWVHDGDRPWVVQLHKGASESTARTVYPGYPKTFATFDVSLGIQALRRLIEDAKGRDEGIVLIGGVGVTSHFGDLLRRAKIPSRIED